MNTRWALALLMIVGLGAAEAHAQRKVAAATPEPSTAPSEDENYFTKVYLVADLVTTAPNYYYFPASGVASGTPATGGGTMRGGMGGGFFSVGDSGVLLAQTGTGTPSGGGVSTTAKPAVAKPQPRSLNDSVDFDPLVEVIQQTLEPEFWDNVGGRGSIAPYGSKMLVVRATAKMHAEIEALLTALRASAGKLRSVTVEAHWLYLSPQELAAIVKDGVVDEAALQAQIEKNATLATGSNVEHDASKPAELNRDKPLVGFQARVTCFDSQTVYVYGAAQMPYTSSVIPVVGQRDVPTPTRYAQRQTPAPPLVNESTTGTLKPASFLAQVVAESGDTKETLLAQVEAPSPGNRVGYQPVTTVGESGVVLQVTPVVVGTGEAADLDIQTTISMTRKFDSTPFAGGTRLDKVDTDLQQLMTTLRVPIGKPVLVGTMPSVVGKTPLPLFLFLKVSLPKSEK